MEPTDYVDSYYARTRADDRRFPILSGMVEADVCVVGGGLAGLNTALELAERGRSVALVEGRRVGWGASGRNGGFVGTGFSLGGRALVGKVGPQAARALYALTVEAVETVRARIDRHAIDCGPVVPGILKASLAEEPEGLKRYIDFMGDVLGEERIEHWPRARLRAALGTERYNDAVLLQRSFHLHSLNYARGIAAAAERAGARLFEGSPATTVALDGPVKEVRTAGGVVRAGAVVFACGGYIRGLHGRLSAATVPVATYVMLTEPLGARMAEVIRVPHGVSDTRFCNDYYRPLADGRILWGGRVSTFHPAPRRIAGQLRRDMLQVYPQLADLRVEVAWGGTMGYPRHKMPQLGTVGDGIWHCMGFGGHGMSTTTMGGTLIAGAIAEGDDRWRMFAPFGLDFAGGPLAKPVAQTIYWAHKARDAWRARRRPRGVAPAPA